MSDQPHKRPSESVASTLQREIFVNGVSGMRPQLAVDPKALKEQARKKMSEKAFAYVAGGAGIESTIDHNRDAFGQYRILPRMLKDVSQRDLSISLLDQRHSSPFLLAPIGVLEMAHREADLAVARAAASMDIPMIFSSQASRPMEACAEVMGNSPRWFQLYWSKSDELVQSFLKRAEAAQCSAIVVTLDTTLLGWRTRDLDLGFLPFLQGKGIAQYVSDPVFQAMLDEPASNESTGKQKITFETLQSIFGLMQRYPGGFWKNLRSGRPLKAVRKFIDVFSRPSLNWDDIARIRQYTSLPILLKGILHPQDARKAVELGVDGLIISNHGGRQIDGSVSSFEMLPLIAKEVKEEIPLLIDSGIRTGADAFKALALGATAVCLGRPYVYALAIAGQSGVEEYIRNMIADLELTMGLAGCTSVSEINADCLRR